ncbi:uncharacterized protein LOC112842687 [Oreochromis niloticus]|uniref:uncharacterized protein LOC112842687 n=1 Tax=Oreochromis niloticus TaxID=8128 RepID=UPI000DF1FE35|nr:uncharacterized protein LOC112842687 [Oreochromis niloticus]
MDPADSFSAEYYAELERMFRFPHPEGNGATATPLLRHLSSYLEGLRGPSGLHLLFPLGVLENRTSLCSPPLEGPRGPSSLRRLQRLRLPRRHLVRPARPARPVRPLSGPMTGRPRRHGRPPVLLRRRRCLPPGRPPELFSWTPGPSSSGPAPEPFQDCCLGLCAFRGPFCLFSFGLFLGLGAVALDFVPCVLVSSSLCFVSFMHA